MTTDRHERKHRRTWKHPEAVAMMASADFGAVPPLADVLAKNFVAEVNGHHVYRNERGRCDLWTRGVGWWGFNLSDEEARSTCTAVSAPSDGRARPQEQPDQETRG
jgi:hypothetical protein